MREPSTRSPFAAMTPQEQRHRWTVWQAQQMTATPVDSREAAQEAVMHNRPDKKQTDVCSLSSALPEPSPPQTPQTPQAVQMPLRAAVRHSQYDAVLKRMRQASRQTGQYAAVPGADSVRQPSSGKP